MKSNTRKWIGLAAAIVLYFIIHEGAHLVFALIFGVFREIRFMGLGMQIAITDPQAMTNLQFAVFNAAGAVASLAAAYVLSACARRICKADSKLFKAVCYYVTIALLFTDPLYLSVLCQFFGGGDMNGIVMFGMSEWTARLIFGVIGLVNLFILIKHVYPTYKKGFQTDAGSRTLSAVR